MSIWDDYKTSVRTRINVKQDRLLLTERQWKLKHYVKLNDKCGKYLWVNAYCPNQELYLWDEEVRKMTDEELATYRAEEKEKRVARAKRRELKAEFDKLKKQKLDKSSTERRRKIYMIWLGLVAFVVVIVMMIIDVKICYSQYAKGLVTKCEVICVLIYTICIPCCFIPPISTESSTSTQSIEITEFKIIKDNTLKDDCFFDTNEYTYTTADNIVYNNVKVDTWGGITDGSITSIEVQNNTPKKLIITENKNFDLRSFFIITTYEYTFV